MRDKKKIAAIMAAIDAYMEDETKNNMEAIRPKGLGEVSLWRVSGRQEIMQMRALWQRRIVSR